MKWLAFSASCRKYEEMRKLNVPLLIAALLTILAFFAHTIGGDMEIQTIKPVQDAGFEKQQIWTMARCGWHWISYDLLFASISLLLVVFSKVFEHPRTVLQLLTLYFFGYAIVWIAVLLLSDSFPYNFLKLGQWMLLLTISSLIYYGNKKMNRTT